jgi:uncharacterized protein YpmS
VQTYSAKKFNFLAVAAILTVLLAAPLTRAQTEKQSKSKMPQKRNVQKSMTINTTNEEKSLDMLLSLYIRLFQVRLDKSEMSENSKLCFIRKFAIALLLCHRNQIRLN